MSTSIPSSVPATSSSHVDGTTMQMYASMQTMSAEDILNYVCRALGNIDVQMSDYKNIVDARQKKAEELREAMSLMNEMNSKADGKIAKLEEPKYNRLMTLLERNLDVPSVRSAYDTFVNSFSGYEVSEDFIDLDGNFVEAGAGRGVHAGASAEDAQDAVLGTNETKGVLENVRYGLESINSDNEMLMMNLQKLMQQRNQISQFASNVLKSLHETEMGIISNLK